MTSSFCTCFKELHALDSQRSLVSDGDGELHVTMVEGACFGSGL
jgi:hypothetical protein